ncbi:hypothetical protein R3X27_11285 [Tropicimonas sp. TH_r6]|uniref:hypothetical protein n=1 Tax=Tropicimonas sp. TH_r6 TaxID=3082085 RepID=UPI002953F489|nr:hypothetical protein [Tropicimonas sp. TH_r6]MDV7143265.1 hypothetical protein [Tropicimonas sp. TH_r6]
MIRDWLGVAAVIIGLAGCSPSGYSPPASDGVSESPINISGTAVTGVVGGSGQSTRMVSEIKDLELSVGLSLDGH